MIRLLLALSILSLLSSPLFSQREHTRFDKTTIADGLSQGSINAMAQDRHGFLWLGTQDGLDRFDGYQFKVFHNVFGDVSTLSDNWVEHLLIDDVGQLWVYTQDAVLHRYSEREETFERFPLPLDDELPGVVGLVAFEGGIWIGVLGHGLLRFDPQTEKFSHYTSENGLPDDRVTAIHAAGEHLWVGFVGGLGLWQQKQSQLQLFPHDPSHGTELQHTSPRSLYEDERGRLWVGSDAGLDLYHPEISVWQEIARQWLPAQAPYNRIVAITRDNQDTIWIGTRRGLFSVSDDGDRVTRFTHRPEDPDSLTDDQIESLYHDRGLVLWVGTRNGLNHIDRGGAHFPHYRHRPNDRNSLSHNIVWMLHEDRAGDLWVGTQAGLDRFRRSENKVKRYKHDPKRTDSLPPGPVTAMDQASDGRLWVLCADTLAVFDPKSSPIHFTYYPGATQDDSALTLPFGNSMLVDSKDQVWVGTAYGLDLLTRDERVLHFRRGEDDPESLSHNQVYVLHEDSKGMLWVGTFGGLNRYDPSTNRFRRYLHDPLRVDSISDNNISQILSDSRGRLWVGTISNGLNLLNPETGTVRRIGDAQGLPGNVINGLAEDQGGFLWASTVRGLARIEPETLRIDVYDVHDGLQSDEFNTGAVFASSRTGELFFGGVNGFNAFFPKRIKPNPMRPAVVITGLDVFNQAASVQGQAASLGKAIHLQHGVKLTHRQSFFSLEFAALHYAYAMGNQYAYKLEGFQEDWIYTSAAHRIATFTNLPPGRYTFRVKAANKDDIWNHKGARLSLQILPPPWRTWWAYTFYTLCLATFIVSYVVSNRAKLDQQRTINQKLRQVDRMKDEFLASTSHELRTPLNGIIGIAESLLVGAAGELNHKLVANLGMIVTSGRRLANLVNEILDFSKLKNATLHLKRKPVDMHALTDVVFTLSESLIGNRKLELINAIPLDAPTVDGDEDRLHQIMHNLVANGVKFTESGYIKVTAQPEGSSLVVTVEDTGIGIDPAQHERIFQSFNQVESTNTRSFDGTGLGLTITRQLIELHGGQISVESRLGGGSKFIFNLPISGKSVFSIARPEQRLVPALQPDDTVIPKQVVTEGKHGFHLLIVDDDAVNRQVLTNHLTLQNYRVSEASDGIEALDAIERETFDLILLDVMMPKISGFEVCRKIRQDHPIHDLPVIFLTAKSQNKDLTSSFAAGGNDYLTKPISRDELLSRVNTHLQLLDITRNLEQKVDTRTRELKMAYKALEEMSYTDPLTGLRNRHFVQKNLEADVSQSLREYRNWLEKGCTTLPPTGFDLTFFLMDFDHFKSINDTYGHSAGDDMLIQVKQILDKAFRSSDYLVRWGGEEFLIISRFTSREMAAGLAERLRRLVADHPFVIDEETTLRRSCSIGFASFPFHQEHPDLLSWTQVVDLADSSLYAAKRGGRNAWVGLACSREATPERLVERALTETAKEVADGQLFEFSSAKIAVVPWQPDDLN